MARLCSLDTQAATGLSSWTQGELEALRLDSNTIFITGGSSGIGRELAAAFHRRGNQVIISGRREDRLKHTCESHPGMTYVLLDVTDPKAIRSTAGRIGRDYPGLNCVINNAGLQRRHDFVVDGPFDDAALVEEVETNVLGVVRVAAAFLPLLRRNPNSTLVNVSSGLAFIPMSRYPVYCATKAAVHSFTLSLRGQLRASGVKVVELVPPWVATELGGPREQPATASGPQPMPLDAFISEAMKGLETDADEVAVGNAKDMMTAACTDAVKRVFNAMNR